MILALLNSHRLSQHRNSPFLDSCARAKQHLLAPGLANGLTSGLPCYHQIGRGLHLLPSRHPSPSPLSPLARLGARLSYPERFLVPLAALPLTRSSGWCHYAYFVFAFQFLFYLHVSLVFVRTVLP